MAKATHRYELVLVSQGKERLTLDVLAAHAGMHPSLVERYVEYGLIEPIEWQGSSSFFDASAVARLRMIGRLRRSLGINIAGIAVILDLREKFCALQRENERLRARL